MKASEFYDIIDTEKDSQNRIASVEIRKDWIKGEFAPGYEMGGATHFKTPRDIYSNYELEPLLRNSGVEFDYQEPSRFPEWLGFFAGGLLPLLLLIGFMYFISRQMQGTGNRALAFGKSKARLHSDNQPKKTFDDVAGCDEAKEDLKEVIDFLQDAKKFQRLGGRIPKGVLLVGPPGTGKTLLARAVAGEAGVPFFSISGSDFVEMFVGVGASRVRDLFETGRRNAPCIIFLDELDAVGRHRGAGIGGGHDEREQTLNQLLVEMDGFNTTEGVILMAATNRPDVLDPALLRPGRFDRQIVVDLPDVRGREGIFRVHTKDKVPLSDDVDLSILARSTPGFSGADIANMVNEAALLAARENKENVDMSSMEEAKDRILMGPERRSIFISESEKRLTAYHEAGHAILSYLIPEADPNYKCSIIPRGRALGVTQKLPSEEKHNYTKSYLQAEITVKLGGRVAEQMKFGEPSTGAKDDLERATDMARKMVCDWGMSDKMGPLTFGKKEEQIFLGREIAQHKDYSEHTAVEIDKEVRRIVEESLHQAETLIKENENKLDRLAMALLEREMLNAQEIEEIMETEDIATAVS
ncbi:ATP-dependent zinc metalloprotease FtsH [Candidatus Poribacteria bacterium]|nr:ATP-dependent zinc metalloprotease FtsH [Candidatus Poribacteria bacterium]